MSLSTDISTIVTHSFNFTNDSRLLTKSMATTTKVIAIPIYFPRLTIAISTVLTDVFKSYPNSKLGIGYMPDTTLYSKIISTVIYFPRKVIDVSTKLIQAMTTVDVKPLKQYLANFWS